MEAGTHVDERADALAMPDAPLPAGEPASWIVLLRSAGLGLAIAGVIGIGWRHTHEPEPAARFCPADGYTTADGTELHRDPDQGCAWVDDDGRRVEVSR